MTPRTFGVGSSRAPRAGGHLGGLRRERVMSPPASLSRLYPPWVPGPGHPQRGTVRLAAALVFVRKRHPLGARPGHPQRGVALVANRNCQLDSQLRSSRSAPVTTFSGVVKASEHIPSEPLPSASYRFLPILTDSYRFSGLSWETSTIKNYNFFGCL